MRAVMSTVRAIADAPQLPGPGDFETEFRPGRAFVQRVGGRNLWVGPHSEAGPGWDVEAQGRLPLRPGTGQCCRVPLIIRNLVTALLDLRSAAHDSDEARIVLDDD
jgi:hypothetical protein